MPLKRSEMLRQLHPFLTEVAQNAAPSPQGIMDRSNVLRLKDGVTAPTTETGWALIYVDTSDGNLKVKFGDGTTKTIAVDS